MFPYFNGGQGGQTSNNSSRIRGSNSPPPPAPQPSIGETSLVRSQGVGHLNPKYPGREKQVNKNIPYRA